MPAPRPTAVSYTTGRADGDPWEYWNEVMRTAFVAMRARPTLNGERPFAATVLGHDVGGLYVSTMRATPHEAARTPTLVRSSAGEDFFLTLVIAGQGMVQQEDRTGLMTPGDFAFIDSARPYRFRFEVPFRQVVVQIPRGLLTSRSVAAEHATATVFPASTGAGVVVAPTLRALADAGAKLDETTARCLAGNIADLLATAVDTRSVPERDGMASTLAAHRRDLHRVKEYLAHRLPDSELSLASVSAALGYSLRYLHRLFREDGTTPNAWLYAQRLDRARALLERPVRPAPPVTAIAARVGFKDSSHFSRAFRTRYGVSPGQYRRGERR